MTLPYTFIMTVNSFQEKNVNTTLEPKHTNFFGIEEVLKTDNMENGSDNTKEDNSDKETHD